MSWYSWLIVIVPFVFVIGLALYARRYIRDVVDFLAAGRICGRYVLSVAGMESALSVMALVAAAEADYKVGFIYGFWGKVLVPITLLISLTGFFSYRFRETKSLTIGEFLEKRYSRSFRIFASFLRTSSEILTNIILPAVTARFFIYLLGWPSHIHVFGIEIPVFSLIIVLTLTFALIVIWSAGMISLVVTDALQAIMCYPIFVIMVVFIVMHFSWFDEMVPALTNRVPGESFLNPYDISELRDFNLFAVFVAAFSNILNRGAWCGGGSDTAARNAHEGKMAHVLAHWRNGFSRIMIMMIAMGVITLMTHAKYVKEAQTVRLDLTKKILEEKKESPEMTGRILTEMKKMPLDKVIPKQSHKNNQDTRYLKKIQSVLQSEKGEAAGNAATLEFRTLFHQMMLPVALKHLLPEPILALMCLLAMMLMLSTDDSRIFSSARTLAQDVVMPFIKHPLTVKQQLWLIRGLTLVVCLIFFFGSIFLSQLDYINLYCTIMAAIWMGGAGSVTLGGVYTRFGTTFGAYASLISGAFIAGGGVLVQRNWPGLVYPFLKSMGWVEPLDKFLRAVASPFVPYIRWEMDPVKFPINSKELFFIAMLVSILAYCLGSLITYKRPYNLDKLLHRGIYNTEGMNEKRDPWTWRTVLSKIIGITPEYTKGDRVIAWSVFYYSFVYGVLIYFCGLIIWNMFFRWPDSWWAHLFFVTAIVIPCIVGTITTVWFMWGGIRDMRQLFKDLAKRKADPTDNGVVRKDP